MDSPRLNRTINRYWSFLYIPETPKSSNLTIPQWEEETWLPVSLPHNWSTYETTGALHPFIMQPAERDSAYWWYGWGWYRKEIIIDVEHADKCWFLEFDGVQKYSKVYVNGHLAGEHKGGFTSFSVEITPYVNFSEPNIVMVAVNNRRNDKFGGIPPMTAGNWNVYGGIYRDVRLVIKDKLHIPFQGSAEYEGGTFITTPEVTAEQAAVRIKTYVRNDHDIQLECLLTNRIVDADGYTIAELKDRFVIPTGAVHEFDQMSGPITGIHLWSPEQPYLYKVISIVSNEGKVVDCIESPLGFRYFHWDYEEKCLYLNGSRIHLHGTNRHQDYPWLGDAIPKWMHEADLRDIRFNLGHNFIRTCHYTQDPYVYELCDRFGILVCEEVPNIKNIRFGDRIQKDHVIEMIRRDRNHPSIIMWSMGNETNCAADPEWARTEDMDRIIHARKVIGRAEDVPHNSSQIDMENLLRCTIRGWYNEDVKPLEPSSGQHTGHERWQHDQASVEGSSQRGRIDMNGVMWLYADHGADREYVNAPLKHVNPKGWTDAYRVPKLMYFLWQANYAADPMVYIHPYDWTSRYIGTDRDILINSNCDRVELWMNEQLIGTRNPDRSNDYTVQFEKIRIREGMIRAVGYRGECKVEHNLVMPGAAASICLDVSHPEIPADGAAIALVHVDIVDQHGVHVFGATNDLHFTISGPGKLVGPNVYTSDINKAEELEGTMYIDAPISMPVRAGYEVGEIRICVSSPELTPAESIIRVLPVQDIHDGLIEPQSTARGSVELWREAAQSIAVSCENFVADSVEDVQFVAGLEKNAYAQLIQQYIIQKNPYSEPNSAAFEALIELMAQQLSTGNGLMVADDYNFNVNRYRNCMEICRILDNTSLPEDIVNNMKLDYVRQTIVEGMEIDPAEETERIVQKELHSH